MYKIEYYSKKYIRCPCNSIILVERFENHRHSMTHTNYLWVNKMY